MLAVLTFVIPAALGWLVDTHAAQQETLGLLLVSAGVCLIGTVVGSTVTTGVGILLYCVGTIAAETPAWVMVIVGAGLLVTFVLHDLAGVARRDPHVGDRFWMPIAQVVAAAVVSAALLFAGIHAVARLTEWHPIAVPIGIATIGFSTKFAADNLSQSVRQP